MKCPVCGNDCIRDAHEIIGIMPEVFAPCPDCTPLVMNKDAPPPPVSLDVCSCGRRFLDVVCAHVYLIMVEEGDLLLNDPLRRIGSPMIHPGFAMESAPFLPEKSLVLLSPLVSRESAERIIKEVPEARGVVRSGDFIPGELDANLTREPRTYELLAGCDVRADIFFTQTSPIVLYKEQSKIHIEFPRGYDPKIIAVGVRVRRHNPRVFVDACCGAGTLGILAGMIGTPHVVLNDAWYAAAFWTSYNLRVNMESMLLERVDIKKDYTALSKNPVVREPAVVAVAEGEQTVEVYQGDFFRLPPFLPKERPILTVFDLFEKKDRPLRERIRKEWLESVGGDIFIP
ncbi:MAG: hypothetical protein QHG99_05335 [Methanomicrobiales archaeon]|nr:hypothetical protein [Methanomicrobiales archaeon]